LKGNPAVRKTFLTEQHDNDATAFYERERVSDGNARFPTCIYIIFFTISCIGCDLLRPPF
jgi:hypothetical protein